MKRMTIKQFRDFIFESYYRRIGFTKENSYYSMKHQKKKDLLSFVTKLLKKNGSWYCQRILLILLEKKRQKIGKMI